VSDAALKVQRAAGEQVRKSAKAAKRPPFSLVMRVAAALIGGLLLLAGYASWASPPHAQVAETTINGKEEVATKTLSQNEGTAGSLANARP
jgi:cell division septal protein FtsQ